MAPLTGKRKRPHGAQVEAPANNTIVKKARHVPVAATAQDSSTTIQIVTGDYERVLHGVVASVPTASLGQHNLGKDNVSWSETFLFSAHTASIRCLAISPVADNGKRFLATGSADERINVYSISNAPPRKGAAPSKPALNGTTIVENANNRSLGSLNNHDRAITRLHFPSKSKLFSSAEDNTVAISRTRDWTMLSSIKAPIPKVQGRPSGDTAAPGEVPTGVNDFAIHPSQKLMLSVCRGERCMRLWNLMTGKKAGVLNFDRELLILAGETKFSSGEGRQVLWDEAGEHYIVGFERAAVVFGIDSKPKAVIKPPTPTKLHQYRVLSIQQNSEAVGLLAISTEDGRVLFFDLESSSDHESEKLPRIKIIAQVGGRSQGVSTRIKDFELLPIQTKESSASSFLVVGAGSDGTIWIWRVGIDELATKAVKTSAPSQVGHLVSRYKTESRITCLGAFVMDGQQVMAEPEATEEPLDDSSSSEDDS